MVLDRAVGPMDAVGTRFGLREARFEAILNTSTVTYPTANVAVLERRDGSSSSSVCERRRRRKKVILPPPLPKEVNCSVLCAVLLRTAQIRTVGARRCNCCEFVTGTENWSQGGRKLEEDSTVLLCAFVQEFFAGLGLTGAP